VLFGRPSESSDSEVEVGFEYNYKQCCVGLLVFHNSLPTREHECLFFIFFNGPIQYADLNAFTGIKYVSK